MKACCEDMKVLKQIANPHFYLDLKQLRYLYARSNSKNYSAFTIKKHTQQESWLLFSTREFLNPLIFETNRTQEMCKLMNPLPSMIMV